MKLSDETIKAIRRLRLAHWDQLDFALDRSGESYYGHLAQYSKRREELLAVVMMAMRDITTGPPKEKTDD